MSIGVVIPTFNSASTLEQCLKPLQASPLKPRILVIDSSSHDETVAIAQRLGVETIVIPHRSFNHGATRERARQLLATDIVVMMTPDACAQDEEMLGRLVAPLLQGEAAVAYGRQIPREEADLFESFSREFNYPVESHLRGIEDVERFGVYLYFCSDSCAAYLNSALEAVGGFDPVLTAEDAVAVARLLRRGDKIAYVAEAVVTHSHRYNLFQEFKRYFDTGLMRRQYQDLFDFGARDIRRGKEFARCFLKRVIEERPRQFPRALLHLSAKWLGYRIGSCSLHSPVWWKKFLGMQSFYWTSEDYLQLREKRLSP